MKKLRLILLLSSMAMTSSAFGWDRSVQMSSGNKYLLIFNSSKEYSIRWPEFIKIPVSIQQARGFKFSQSNACKSVKDSIKYIEDQELPLEQQQDFLRGMISLYEPMRVTLLINELARANSEAWNQLYSLGRFDDSYKLSNPLYINTLEPTLLWDEDAYSLSAGKSDFDQHVNQKIINGASSVNNLGKIELLIERTDILCDLLEGKLQIQVKINATINNLVEIIPVISAEDVERIYTKADRKKFNLALMDLSGNFDRIAMASAMLVPHIEEVMGKNLTQIGPKNYIKLFNQLISPHTQQLLEIDRNDSESIARSLDIKKVYSKDTWINSQSIEAKLQERN